MKVPINPNVMKQYRDNLSVPSSPSFIDTDVPINPSVIMNTAENPVLNSAVERGELKYAYQTGNLGGTGTITRTYTVPSNKKWILKGIYNSNGATITRLIIYVSIPSITGLFTLYDSAAVFTTYTVFSQPIILPEGWVVTFQYSVTADGNTTNSTLYQEFDQEQ